MCFTGMKVASISEIYKTRVIVFFFFFCDADRYYYSQLNRYVHREDDQFPYTIR